MQFSIYAIFLEFLYSNCVFIESKYDGVIKIGHSYILILKIITYTRRVVITTAITNNR